MGLKFKALVGCSLLPDGRAQHQAPPPSLETGLHPTGSPPHDHLAANLAQNIGLAQKNFFENTSQLQAAMAMWNREIDCHAVTSSSLPLCTAPLRCLVSRFRNVLEGVTLKCAQLALTKFGFHHPETSGSFQSRPNARPRCRAHGGEDHLSACRLCHPHLLHELVIVVLVGVAWRKRVATDVGVVKTGPRRYSFWFPTNPRRVLLTKTHQNLMEGLPID